MRISKASAVDVGLKAGHADPAFADRLGHRLGIALGRHQELRVLLQPQARSLVFELQVSQATAQRVELALGFEALLIECAQAVGQVVIGAATGAQLGERLSPIDRLGDPRRLVQVETSQLLHGSRDLTGERHRCCDRRVSRNAVHEEQLRRPDVDYVSVKISAICARLDVLAFEHSVGRIVDHLEPIFAAAGDDVTLEIDDSRTALVDRAVAFHREVMESTARLKEQADAVGLLQARGREILRSVEANPGLRLSLGRNGRRFFERHYAWPVIERKYLESENDYARAKWSGFLREIPCPSCNGQRLRPEVLAVKVFEKSIADVASMSLGEAVQFFETIELDERDVKIAAQVLRALFAHAPTDGIDDVGLAAPVRPDHAHQIAGKLDGRRVHVASAARPGAGPLP